MKLNLGCGHNKLDGYLNVDGAPACEPDVLHDLESFPWPFEDDAADEVVMSHVLEHLGATPAGFLGVIKELYRVCRPAAQVTIVVPHPRHDFFLADPTHVRPILPESLQLFSKAKNREYRDKNISNTPLGEYLDVDFEIEKINYVPDKAWLARLQKGEITNADLSEAMDKYNNVIEQIECVLRAVKPRGRAP